jgi:hypothetical protein
MRVIEIEWVDEGPRFCFGDDEEEEFRKALDFFTMTFSYRVIVYHEEDRTDEA